MTLRAIAGGGGGATLKTNGTTNSTQTLLNLSQGGGVTISEAAGTVTIASTNADATLLFAGAPNTDFDLTNGGAGGAVTILSKTIAGIVAGDQIILDVWYTILNNSTANRNYTPAGNLGSLGITGTEATAIATSATNRSARRLTVEFSVSATTLAYAQMCQLGLGGIAANSATTLGTGVAIQGWNTTGNDLTGPQTATFTVSSSATTATQTLTLHSFTIRKISAI